MKETGFCHWDDPNTGATNESGFTGLGGGYRDHQGNFAAVKEYGNWWTKTTPTGGLEWNKRLESVTDDINETLLDKNYGYSVRLIQD